MEFALLGAMAAVQTEFSHDRMALPMDCIPPAQRMLACLRAVQRSNDFRYLVFTPVASPHNPWAIVQSLIDEHSNHLGFLALFSPLDELAREIPMEVTIANSDTNEIHPAFLILFIDELQTQILFFGWVDGDDRARTVCCELRGIDRL